MAVSTFYKPSRRLTAGEAAEITGASLYNEDFSSVVIHRLASIEDSGPGAVIFIENKQQNLKGIENLVAEAVFCCQEVAKKIPSGIAILVSEQPYRDFSMLGRVLFPDSVKPSTCFGEIGISPQAFIHPTAKIGDNVTIEAGAAVGKGAEVGRGTTVASTATIGAHCCVGQDCFIANGVSLQYSLLGDRVYLYPGARIGQDGFGYISTSSGIEKIPQLGRVIIHHDVEIGANTTVDRGGLSDTIIGEGTKIDNLVQIAHNVQIGRFCIIAALSGIAGSVSIGDMTVIGGRVGVKDHVKIGSRVQIAGASGVMNDVPDGEKWGGFPARPFKQWFREVAALRNIGKSSGKRS